jgi:hypothetical protein
VLLFHLVSGRFPVESDALPELERAHDSARRVRLRDLRPDLDDAFVAAVETAVSPTPQQRFESVGALERALAEPAEPVRTQKGGVWRGAWIAAIIVAVGFAGLSVMRSLSEPVGVNLPGADQVDATLYRHGADGAEILVDGRRVRVGDRLSLNYTATVETYVYVFNVDEHGNAFGLFPLEALGQGNPLKAGESHELPGRLKNGTLTWLVDRAGGMEQVHLVASPLPVPEIERQYRRLPPANVSNSALGQRGMGQVSGVSPAMTVSAAPLVQAVQDASQTGERHEGVWYRTFHFPGDSP